MTEHNVDVAIIGAGPTGLYAAYYAGFRGWSTAVVDALPEVGGQITAMYPEKDIFDVAGFPVIRGRVLVEDLKKQADQFAPTYLLGDQATALDAPDGGPITLTLAGGDTVTSKAAIITGGIGSFKPRPLPAGGEWEGKGLVFFIPAPDVHAGKDIVIVGGGDSALDWAHMLHPIAKSVTVVHRRDQFRAHATMVDRARDLGIELITPCEVTAVRGDTAITEVEVTSKTDGSIRLLPADTVVAALGFIANIGPMAEWGLDLEKRHIKVGTDMSTNLPGVFAAGDIAVYNGKVPLIAIGFGEAALAVNNAAPLVSPELGVFPGHSSGESNSSTDFPRGAFQDVLEANEEFAETFSAQALTGTAREGLAIVTCMDSRVVPLSIVGMEVGDVKILRNAGARVTDDVLRTLVLATHLLGVNRVLVMPHTNCKMASATAPEIHEALQAASGLDTRSLDIAVVPDQVEALKYDLVRIRAFPYLPDDLVVGGAIYDVVTGRLHPVDA